MAEGKLPHLSNDTWLWPYVPEVDKWNMCRVPIPEGARVWISGNQKVRLVLPDGKFLEGTVKGYNKSAWIARVQVEGSGE